MAVLIPVAAEDEHPLSVRKESVAGSTKAVSPASSE
jgi:hypothetical protein